MGSNPDAAVYFSNDVPRADKRNSLQFAMNGTTSYQSPVRSSPACAALPFLSTRPQCPKRTTLHLQQQTAGVRVWVAWTNVWTEKVRVPTDRSEPG